jgi:DNA-binding transcriptional LysR family regulator
VYDDIEEAGLPPAAPPRRPTRLAMNIPTDLLRSFLAIVDAGSMAHAKEVIFLTQSAISLQMKRLEDMLQQRMFQRNGRSLVLTAAGEELVGLARELLEVNDRIVSRLGTEIDPRPLQLGLVGDFADTVLPGVLAAFAKQHPRQRLRLTVDGSAGLVDAFERSQLDVVLCMGHQRDLRRGRSKVVAKAQMVWIGAPHLALEEELPLVLLDAPCTFRTALLEQLELHQRRYRIVLETPHLPGMVAAVQAGLGVTCRTDVYAATLNLPIIAKSSLPELPTIDHVLLYRHDSNRPIDALVRLLSGSVPLDSTDARASTTCRQEAVLF